MHAKGGRDGAKTWQLAREGRRLSGGPEVVKSLLHYTVNELIAQGTR